MGVLQNFQKCRLLWHGRTQPTQVPGGYKWFCARTPGIVARGVQNSQKFRVRVWTSYRTNRNSGTGMKVLQNFQKCRVLWHGRTELAEAPGTGKTRVSAHPLWGQFNVKWRLQSNLHGIFSHGANVPEAICREWWIIDQTTTERGDRVNLNEWRPGPQPRSLLYCAVTNHTYHGVPRLWRFKLNNGDRNPILLHQLDISLVPRQRSESTQNTENSSRRRW